MSFGSIEGAAIRLDRSSLEELARILARKDVAAMPTTRLLRAAAAMPIAAAARSSKPSTRHRSRRASGSLLANPRRRSFFRHSSRHPCRLCAGMQVASGAPR